MEIDYTKIEKCQSIKNSDTNKIEKVYIYIRIDDETLRGYPVEANSIKEAKKIWYEKLKK